MRCPFCGTGDSKVIDSRLSADGDSIRRRRNCAVCNGRFTTYEVAEMVLPSLIKRDKSRVVFSEDKLRAGFLKALEKRPVSVDAVEAAIKGVMRKLIATGEREVASSLVGHWVMDALRDLDKVAYVRFASVYRSFQDVNEFQKEIDLMEKQANSSR